MNFSEMGSKIKLEIHEPWNAYQILRGRIIRPIRSIDGKICHLFQGEDDQWLIIAARYLNDQVEDVYLAQRVHVVVAAVRDWKVLESDHFKQEQVDYLGIGVIEELAT